MNLLVRRKEVPHRAERTIVLDAQVEGRIHRQPEPATRLELPAVGGAGSLDRASQHRVQVNRDPAELPLQDRAELECRILVFVLLPGEGHLGAQADLDRQPALGEPHPRAKPHATKSGLCPERRASTRYPAISKQAESPRVSSKVRWVWSLVGATGSSKIRVPRPVELKGGATVHFP